FQGEEFAWADSAYPLSPRVIPVHKKPASLRRENQIFDRLVSHIRVRSEHCMGALKGRFQCLRGLRVAINSAEDHVKALRWIKVAIILHNLVVDVEGQQSAGSFTSTHTHTQEEEDSGDSEGQDEAEQDDDEGERKRQKLIAELLEYRYQRRFEGH
ncbi:hypothetical protein OH76DRAFT_1356611, partial [Lentinus brumalis]